MQGFVAHLHGKYKWSGGVMEYPASYVPTWLRAMFKSRCFKIESHRGSTNIIRRTWIICIHMPYANAQISSNLTLPGLIVEALSTMNHLSHGWSPKKCNTNDPQVQPRCLQHASHVGCHLLCLHNRNAKHVAASCSLSSNVCELFPVLTEQLHCSQRRRNRRICPTSTNSQNICCRWESVVREDYQSIKPKKTAQKQSIIYWSGRPIHQSSKKSVGPASESCLRPAAQLYLFCIDAEELVVEELNFRLGQVCYHPRLMLDNACTHWKSHAWNALEYQNCHSPPSSTISTIIHLNSPASLTRTCCSVAPWQVIEKPMVCSALAEDLLSIYFLYSKNSYSGIAMIYAQ